MLACYVIALVLPPGKEADRDRASQPASPFLQAPQPTACSQSLLPPAAIQAPRCARLAAFRPCWPSFVTLPATPAQCAACGGVRHYGHSRDAGAGVKAWTRVADAPLYGSRLRACATLTPQRHASRRNGFASSGLDVKIYCFDAARLRYPFLPFPSLQHECGWEIVCKIRNTYLPSYTQCNTSHYTTHLACCRKRALVAVIAVCVARGAREACV